MVPTLADVHAARTVVYRTLKPTPLLRHPLLDAKTGLTIHVKHENYNPTGAFKVRGGLNLIASLTADERRGVITATTGNHGQSIALACQREGVPCTIVVPLGNNPDKNAAMRALGADVVEFGRDFDQARERVEELQRANGLRYVHSANEPLLIAGVATYALEIFEDLPDADVVLVPIGGGSGACGCALVALVARPEGGGHRDPGRRRRRIHPVVADRHARDRRSRGDVRRGHGDAGDLRPDVRHPAPRAERHRDADRGGARRRRAPRPRSHAQPRRRRRRRLARGGRQAPRPAARQTRRLRDERRKHRPRDIDADPER